MDIVYVYQRKRRDFGRHGYFSDRNAELLADITPDESQKEMYIERDAAEASVQNTKEFSEHEVCPVSFRSAKL